MNSVRLENFVLCVLLIFAVHFSCAENTSSANDALNHLKLYSNFDLSKEKSVVLVIGNNYFGKNYLTKFFEERSNHRYKLYSKATHHYDVVRVYKKDNTTYYNCPAFDDSHLMPIESKILALHCIRTVINYAHEIKLLFVIEKFEDFEKLAQFVTSFIRNVDALKDGIALIQAIPKENQIDTTTNSIAEYLNSIKSQSSEQNKKLIDILLEQDHKKIGLFHEKRFNDEHNAELEQEIDSISSIVNSNLKYVRSDANDFDFVEKFAELKPSANEITRELQADIESSFDFDKNCDEINWFFDSFKNNENSDGHPDYNPIMFSSPLKWRFAEQIYKMNALATVPSINIEKLDELADLLDFLQSISSNQTGLTSSQIAGKLQSCLNDLRTISCTGDKLLVKGVVVFISDVIRDAECWPTATSIDIYAIDKVFIDANIDAKAKEAKITIISPTQKPMENVGETSQSSVDFLGACTYPVDYQYIEVKNKNG